MPENRIRELIDKLLRKQCTAEEQEELFMLIQAHKAGSSLQSLLEEAWNRYKQPTDEAPEEVVTAILQAVHGQDTRVPKPDSRKRRLRWIRIAAAVAILLVLAAGVQALFFQNKNPAPPLASQRLKEDIPPPQINKAILTLANGKNIVLDSAVNGTLAVQGGTQVQKNARGGIVYSGKNLNRQVERASYNTLTVPRGSKPVQLTLADGSKVWLDVASSITYPVAFVGSKRSVRITGEAYFEVAKNATRPFVVKSNDATIEVLGTRFNVNAYRNERSVNVTLLEGSVRVRAKGSGQSAVISPGEQIRVSEDAQIKIVKNADIEEAMAWKNGRFIFTGIPIQAIMRQVERWYDVDVQYKGAITKEDFVGYISRYTHVSALLSMLEKTRLVRFEIEGHQIIVKPYKEEKAE